MRLLLLPIITLILLIAVPQNLNANNRIPVSNALQTLMYQAEQIYLAPEGRTIRNVDPNAVASVLGLAMQGQKAYLKQNRSYQPQFDALNREITSFLGELATSFGNRNPSNGMHMDGNSLSEQYFKYLSGSMNGWVMQNKYINPAQVWQPFILNQVTVAQHVSPPSRVPDSTGVFVEREEEPDGIELLGQRAGLVKNNVGTNPTVSFAGIGNKKKKEIQKTPIRKGVIFGNWQAVNNSGGSCRVSDPLKRMPKYNINFQRGSGKTLYVGSFEIEIYSTKGEYNYVILSEKQIDPYTIEYKSMLTSKNKSKWSLFHGMEFTTTVYKDDKNRLVLCRGSIRPFLEGTYIK